MIKVEKTGNDVAISEVIGSTYDLIYEFHVALKAIYRVLDGSIAKSAPFDTEGFLHTIQNVVAARGYYPADVKIKDYDKDFIDGCLIGAWQQVYGMIREMKEKQEVPFNN